MPVMNLIRGAAAADAPPPSSSSSSSSSARRRRLDWPPAAHAHHIPPHNFLSSDQITPSHSTFHNHHMYHQQRQQQRLLPYGIPKQNPTSAAGLNYNYSSSGSDHDPSSVCLAEMVHDFLSMDDAGGHDVGTCGFARCNCADGVCSSDEAGDADGGEDQHGSEIPAAKTTLEAQQICDILEGVTSYTNNPELSVLVDVVKAVEAEMEASGEATAAGDSHVRAGRLRRPVMRRLREEMGYNAAICKSRWDHREGLPAGDYEYMDVLVSETSAGVGDGGSATDNSNNIRLIIDIDFRSQFVIARASTDYSRLLEVLPRIFVGRVERLKQVLKIMATAAKRSLKQQGLHLPPWRKLRYLQAKWFSAYRRTTNSYHHSSSAAGYGSPAAADDAALLVLGLRSHAEHRVFSTEFAKEMDMAFFNAAAAAAAQDYAMARVMKKSQSTGRWKGLRAAEGICWKEAAPPPRYAGFAAGMACKNNGRPLGGVCTAMCTDWELPELEKKPGPWWGREAMDEEVTAAAVVAGGLSSLLHRERKHAAAERAAASSQGVLAN